MRCKTKNKAGYIRTANDTQIENDNDDPNDDYTKAGIMNPIE